ncbi:MAG: hypothetical protein ACJ74L_11520 [Gaiellaceae bacterium]
MAAAVLVAAWARCRWGEIFGDEVTAVTMIDTQCPQRTCRWVRILAEPGDQRLAGLELRLPVRERLKRAAGSSAR